MNYPEDYIGKIIQGDCLEVMKGMPDKCVDLVLTDPPYGKMWTRGKNGFGSNNFITEDDKTEWDVLPMKEVFDEMIRVSKNQIIFGGNYFTDKLPPSKCWLVWDKKGGKNFKNPFADCELIWTSFNKVVKKYTFIQQGFVSETKDKRVHPTQKPTELLNMILQDFPAEIIFDPFLGSGSVAVIAKNLGKQFIGIEISEKYCEIARGRLLQETLF